MAHRPNIYDLDLEKNAANHAPLTPLSFLAWTAEVYPQRLAVVHGARRLTWGEVYARSRRPACALAARGVGPGEAVAALRSTTPERSEAHFGVPMTGAVLNALNPRLDAEAIAFMLAHGEAKVLLTDREFSPTIAAALAKVASKPLIVDVLDPEHKGPGDALGSLDYTQLLASGDPSYPWQPPSDEWNAI